MYEKKYGMNSYFVLLQTAKMGEAQNEKRVHVLKIRCKQQLLFFYDWFVTGSGRPDPTHI